VVASVQAGMTDTPQQSQTVKLLAGAAAGIVAGILASFAMDRFQAAVTALSPSGDSGSDEDPATVKAAEMVTDVPEADKPLAGQLVHYAVGTGLGLLYGLLAEVKPGVTAGYGTAFGTGTAALLDEAAVPAAGLGAAPWKTDAATHLYGLASHLVFGLVAELTRSQVRATLAPE